MRKSELHRVWPLGLMLACATLSHGQSKNGPPINSKDAAKTAAEASRMLGKAKTDVEAEADRTAATAAPLRRMQAIVDQAKVSGGPTRPSFAEQARDADSRKRLDDAMTRVAPEGKAILAQNGTVPSLRAPADSGAPASSGGSTGTKASPLSNNGPGPKPQPLKPTPLAPTEKPPAVTEITSGTGYFDTKSGFGVFVDDVVLNHPEFHLTSDELEVYMNKEEPKDKDANGNDQTAAPAGPTAGELAQLGAAEATPGKGEPAPSARKQGGNIKTAIARGKRVLIVKTGADGEQQTGIGREAVYDGATGDVILRGWPQIQKGNSLAVAIEPTTYFIIKADGHFFAQGGRQQTRIIQEEDKKAAPAPAAPGTTPTVPTPPAPVLKPQGGQR